MCFVYAHDMFINFRLRFHILRLVLRNLLLFHAWHYVCSIWFNDSWLLLMFSAGFYRITYTLVTFFPLYINFLFVNCLLSRPRSRGKNVTNNIRLFKREWNQREFKTNWHFVFLLRFYFSWIIIILISSVQCVK